MRKVHWSWCLSAVALLVVLGMLVGCGPQSAAPPITPTPGFGGQAAPPGDGTPDILATSRANATLAAQPPDTGGGTSPVETPTVPSTAAPTSSLPTLPPATVAPTAVPTIPPVSTSPPSGGTTTHVVQPGENLFRIALRYGTTFEELAKLNGIANPSLIYVGQVLTVPAGTSTGPQPGGTTYVVQPGDNLFRIALRYNMSYTYLAQYNGIADPSRIYVGQVIRIPPR